MVGGGRVGKWLEMVRGGWLENSWGVEWLGNGLIWLKGDGWKMVGGGMVGKWLEIVKGGWLEIGWGGGEWLGEEGWKKLTGKMFCRIKKPF